MDALDKEQAKVLLAQHREFKTWFKIVRSKIRKIKAKKEFKKLLREDLKKCNNAEIMHYLAHEATFSTIEAYLKEVNDCVQFQAEGNNYTLPVYNGQNFKMISDIIRKYTNLTDRKERLKKMIMG